MALLIFGKPGPGRTRSNDPALSWPDFDPGRLMIQRCVEAVTESYLFP